MNFKVTGKQIDIGAALQTQTRDSLTETVEKYAGWPTDAGVTFSRDGYGYVCEITVHLSTGLVVSARGQDAEIYAALDQAVQKTDKQLRRYKRRLKDHHRQRATPVALSEANSYILTTPQDDHEAEPETLQPVIVAEMETKVPSLSVGEAVIQMELVGAPVLVFRNEGDDRVNVVYRRDDGNIGWIDPGS